MTLETIHADRSVRVATFAETVFAEHAIGFRICMEFYESYRIFLYVSWVFNFDFTSFNTFRDYSSSYSIKCFCNFDLYLYWLCISET